MTGRASLLLHLFSASLKNNPVKSYRLTRFFPIAVTVVLLTTLVYTTIQWNKPNHQQFFSDDILADIWTTPLPSKNRSETFLSVDYYFSRYQNNHTFSSSSESSTAFAYSESVFRSPSSPPILWLDSHGDVRWNEAAEREMFSYLSHKQTIDSKLSEDQIIDECLRRKFFVILQHDFGFFSRHHCFIEQFGQTLYSPWMTLLSYNSFLLPEAHREDFLAEGILRYFEPISTCSKYVRHPRMKTIELRLRGHSDNSFGITDIHQLLYDDQLKANKTFSILDNERVWSFGYDHIPLRRWMFSYNRIAPTYKETIIKDSQ